MYTSYLTEKGGGQSYLHSLPYRGGAPDSRLLFYQQTANFSS